MGKLLTLDLSTVSTGWAIFDIETRQLERWGLFKPQCKVPRGTQYPKVQLYKLQDLADQLRDFIDNDVPGLERIAIEEINRGVSRLSQKTLDGLHYILLDRIQHKIDLVYYRDSDGAIGWRPQLGLLLSDQDKLLNDQRRKLNKKLGKGQRKYPVITKKHLACRFANAHYGHLADWKNLDCDLRVTDSDQADAIGLGHAILHRVR